MADGYRRVHEENAGDGVLALWKKVRGWRVRHAESARRFGAVMLIRQGELEETLAARAWAKSW